MEWRPGAHRLSAADIAIDRCTRSVLTEMNVVAGFACRVLITHIGYRCIVPHHPRRPDRAPFERRRQKSVDF
jgi:hypothetical protein